MTREEHIAAIANAEQRILDAAIDYASRPSGSGPAVEVLNAIDEYRDALLAPVRLIIGAASQTWAVLDLTDQLGGAGRNAHRAAQWWLGQFGGDEVAS